MLNRHVARNVAVALVLLLSAAGVWLALEGIGAARADLALAKWVYLLSLLVLVCGSTWEVVSTRSKLPRPTLGGQGRLPMESGSRLGTPLETRILHQKLGLGTSTFPDVLEYAVVSLLVSGMYVLVAYSLNFGSRYWPWYNGLIGLQGLLLLVLASVVFVGKVERQTKGQWFLRLVTMLSSLVLLLSAVFDVVPYLS
ncbi:MAG: hypothetical protein HY675_08040 [Chloroflexi bacterium]|nr:hypothetical protein [Chloroflexota bacterium]